MTADKHLPGPKDDWRAWPSESLEGMPPKRRRLVGWGLAWWLLFLPVLGAVLQWAGLPQGVSQLLALAAAAAFFFPLVRAVQRENRQLRAEGVGLPYWETTRKSLVFMAAMTAVLWLGYLLLLALTDKQPVPVLPIVTSAWLIFQIRASRVRDRRTHDSTP